MGRIITFVLNRIRLEYDGLYSVTTMALVPLIYGATTALGGNGFLAVYLAGLVAGNRSFIHKRSLTEFHSGLAWLMQIVMFLTLGLLVFPSQLMPCLLYTSDAADDLLCVDLGGRRIINKKTKHTKLQY